MDDRQETPQELAETAHTAVSKPPARRRWRLWLFVIPLMAWLACVGLAVAVLSPLVLHPERVEIPNTGGDGGGVPGKTPAATQAPQATRSAPDGTPASAADFLDAAQKQLDTCSSSFHDYFVLEQVAVDQPEVFKDPNWRSDATDAMHAFRDDCQALGTLPSAPASLTEIDHWLKLAAGEVGPATDSFTTALQKNQSDEFRTSVSHLLKFVDYIHNAEGAMDGLKQRKEI